MTFGILVVCDWVENLVSLPYTETPLKDVHEQLPSYSCVKSWWSSVLLQFKLFVSIIQRESVPWLYSFSVYLSGNASNSIHFDILVVLGLDIVMLLFSSTF